MILPETRRIIMKALLAIDQGTTSTRAVLFDDQGNILNICQRELALQYPQKGWVEQDPNDIKHDVIGVVDALFDDSNNQQIDIQALGITNQRETTILWNTQTGEAIYNAIVWQDKRTVDYCAQLKEGGHEDMVREKTGLLLDPYFSATKIKWILDHVDGARQLAQQGALAFGTVDSFLLWHLTKGEVHATDATNAARTLLFNIQTQQWDDELLNLFDIPVSILPVVKDNCADFGTAHFNNINVPITAMAGDQHAAMVGQACFQAGMVKSTYGTGCFALMNIGDEFKLSQNQLLTTLAYRLNGKPCYALEGAIFVAGAAIQWLRDNLEFFDNAAQSEVLAFSVPDNNCLLYTSPSPRDA